MAISSKRKRKITVGGKQFFWIVKPDDDYTEINWLTIISDDGAVCISYCLNQFQYKRRWLSLSSERKKEFIRIYDPPIFEDQNHIIKPSSVAALIKWVSQEPMNSCIREIEDEINAKAFKKLREIIKTT